MGSAGVGLVWKTAVGKSGFPVLIESDWLEKVFRKAGNPRAVGWKLVTLTFLKIDFVLLVGDDNIVQINF